MNIDEFEKIMIEYGQKINIKFTKEQLNQFYEYMNLLLEWNEKINLTAITEPKEIILKHSRSFNGYLKDSECIKLAEIDRGTYYKYKRELLEEGATNIEET